MVKRTTAKMKLFLSRIISYLIIVIAVICIGMPFSTVISTSFKATTSVFAYPPEWIPKNPTIANYIVIITEYLFPRWFLNTVIVVLVVVIAKVFIDSLAGFAFAKGQFKGKETIFNILLLTMMIPFAVTMIPTFFIIREFRLVNTYGGIILPMLAKPIGIFMMRQYIVNVPSELLDAARVDGCSEFGIYTRIVLPITSPGLLALATFIFVDEWCNFLWPLIVIQSEKMKVLSLAIPSMQGTWMTNWGQVSAAAVLTIVPVVVLFAIMHKYFVAGIRMGALKG